YGHVTEEAVRDALGGFIGEQEQVAPLFSAKSVDGVRAYELARKLHREGGSMDEAARELIRTARIRISELELLSFSTADGQQGESSTASPSIQEDANPDDGPAASGHPSASSRINVTDNSALGLPRAEIRIACSKGTYIRAFARDLGEALGTGAHLDSLRRTASGIFRAEDALSVEQVIDILGA
ncbi:MAG: hypothetical protein ACI3ZL_06235, partial [Candidatus Cryptobacteroides sp.]